MSMSFGLHSALATFQRLIDHILQDCLPFSRSFIDDIAIFSDTVAGRNTYVTSLREVFIRLARANLTEGEEVQVWECHWWGTDWARLREGGSCPGAPKASGEDGCVPLLACTGQGLLQSAAHQTAKHYCKIPFQYLAVFIADSWISCLCLNWLME